MTSGHDITFAPRTIAQARSRRMQRLGRRLRIAVCRAMRRLRGLPAEIALSSRYHRELALLLHADDRMLADIGLTRYDVTAAAQASRGWFGRRDALRAAAQQRDDAAMSRAQRSTLPQITAPALVPAVPHTMETSHFR